MNANATATATAMETPPSPLALFVRLACDPAGAHTPAFAWHSFERDPVTWSYARTYRAAAAAASKVWKVVDARGDPPPRVSPLQTSPEHRAHCVGACVSEGPGLLLLTLAVGLCGCAFVPLSKHDPPRRMAAAMRDAKVSAVVVDDDDDARRVVAEALISLQKTSRDAPGSGTEDPGTGNAESSTTNRRTDAKNGRDDFSLKKHARVVDVLRLSEVFDARAWEDGTEDGTGSAAIGETPEFPDGALVAALADLDLDTCIERHPERISHVFFTSGSTGTPKGCVATRGALAWFVAGKRETHRLDASSVVLVASPHVFDPSLGDVYASLAAGGCVALCPEAKLVSHLGACLAATAATHLTATPTALGSVRLANVSRIEKSFSGKNSLSPSRATTNERKSACPLFPALRVVALGGEPTPRTLAETWVGLVPTLANTYGVTECCVYQTFSKIEAGDAESRRRLGGVFPGVRAIHAAPPGDDPANVVDDDASAPRDGSKNKTHDTPAELWLAGPQVGLGYAGDPTLTSARFRVVVGADGNEERLFRTGDVTKRGEGGGRVLLGRGDGQVKIRGRRVELGEIETAMRECLRDIVRDVAVTVTGKDGDGGSDGALVAWAVPLEKTREGTRRFENVSKTHAETTHADSNGLGVLVDDAFEEAFETPTATTCDAMRWVLASRLPAYMLPSRFAFVRALPRTASGKTARAAMARRGVPPPPARRVQSAFPRRERVLGALVHAEWSRELGVPPHAITRASRFAELGGDSMVAARVCRGVYAATRAAGAGAEAAGAHGEFLTGALAPASLAGNVSLGTFVSRVAADLRADLGTDLGTDSGTDSDETLGDGSEDASASFDETGSDDGSVSAGVSLLYRAAREDAPGIAMALLRRGVPVDGWRDARSGSPAREGASVFTKKKTNLFASSPLHAACGAGAEAAAAVLLEGGALPRARARRGATPLHLAAGAARLFSAEGLRRVLARADEGGKSSKSSALAFLDDDKQSALHYAARAGAAAGAVEWLMDTAETLRSQRRLGFGKSSAAFSEWRDVWGRTAMHWAALNGHGAVVAVLLKKGASPRVADARGETPVALAERRALCSARDRPDGERASRWGDVAALLGGAGTTKHLKKSLSAPNK